MLNTRQFLAERRSVAALEFALVLPLMLVLIAGVYDITEALIVNNTVNDIANGVVTSASIVAEQTGENMQNATALSFDQVQEVESTIWADFPDLRRGQKNGNKSVTLTSVTFQPNSCSPSGAECALYAAFVVWSETYDAKNTGQTFQTNLRKCSPLNGPQLGAETQVASGTALTLSNFTYTLPTLTVASNSSYPAPGDETGPPPILVADVTFTYTPLFNFYIKSNITFLATALWPIRTAKATSAATANGQTYLPLSQEYTTIMGKVNNGTLTLYNPGGPGGAAPTVEADAPTVSTASGAGTSAAGDFCINTYLTNAPFVPPYSQPPTTS